MRVVSIMRFIGGGKFPVRAVVLSAVLVTVVSAPALAGDLKGKVTVAALGSVQKAVLNPYPGIAGNDEPAPLLDPTDPRDVVVYLEGDAIAGRKSLPGAPPKLYQINRTFQPRVIGIPVGATVEFPNGDKIFHNVFSYSPSKRFDLGYYGKGKSKSVSFDKPGLVRVFCEIHSNMSAFILVVDTPYVTVPDKKGEFTFPDLPAGTYTVTFWHPDRGEIKQVQEVGEGVTRVTASM